MEIARGSLTVLSELFFVRVVYNGNLAGKRSIPGIQFSLIIQIAVVGHVAAMKCSREIIFPVV